MAFKKKTINEIFGVALVLSALLSTASAVDCLGKSFQCVNSTHFMICVDVGGGVSQSIDDFFISCPPPTVCQGTNHFECEFPTTTNTPSTTLSNLISESTLPWEEVAVTTVSPPPNTTKEFSEKYVNTESITTLSADIITTGATVDYTTEAASLIDDVNITQTDPSVTEALLYDTTSQDVITQMVIEHNMTSTGELLAESANNYTLVQKITNYTGSVSNSTEKAISTKSDTTEAALLIDDISMTETGPAVTEALPYDTTTSQDVITQTVTEHFVATAGGSLTETANNYTLVQQMTKDTGSVSNSTKKAVSTKSDTTEAALLMDDISMTETEPAVTEALPYDITTSQDIITQTITEHFVATAGGPLTETANNYTFVQQITNDTGSVSNSTEKAICTKPTTNKAASLIDDISMIETGPAVTEALPYDTTTSQDVITQTVTEHFVATAGGSLTETANNYTLVQQMTKDTGSVSNSTKKAVSTKLDTTEAALLIDDISMTETEPAVTEALPYDITTSQDIITQTITEHFMATAGGSLTQTVNNYTLVQQITNDTSSVSNSTEKAISTKLDTTEAALLIDDISMTETGPAVTEALSYEITISQDVITQTVTEHFVATAGGSLTETANNYTLVQQMTNDTGSVSNSTKKAVSTKSDTTEAALLIDDISMTETGPAVTEALPYDITTSQDIITQTITEHFVATAGGSLTQTANNYTLVQQITNDTSSVSNSTEKAISTNLDTTEAALLIDDISMIETKPTVTDKLPHDHTITTTSQHDIKQTITEHFMATAGGSLTETANNYTLVQQINDSGLVSNSTEKVIPSKFSTTKSASLIDDITENGPTVTEALPYGTTTSKDLKTQTITEKNVAPPKELLTETDNNYTLVQQIKNASLVPTSSEKGIPLKINTTEDISLFDYIGITEAVPAVTEALPYDTTTSQDDIAQTITEHNVATAVGFSPATPNNYTFVKKITTDAVLVSTSTEEIIPVIFKDTSPSDIPKQITIEPENVDIRKTGIVAKKNVLNHVKTPPESITTESSIVTELPITPKDVFSTDVNLINTEQRASIEDMFPNTNILDYITTTESELPTTVDAIITSDVNLISTEQPAEADLVPTTLSTNSLHYTTISESTTVENVILKQRNLTVFRKDAVADTNAKFGNEISLAQKPIITNNKETTTNNNSSGSSTTEKVIVDMSYNSITTDIPAMFTTETVYKVPNDTRSTTNEDVFDQTILTSNSIVVEASVGTELPTTVDMITPLGSTVSSLDRNAENQSVLNYLTTIATTSVEDEIRTKRLNFTLFEENTVTNLVTESPLFLKQNLTDNIPVYPISTDNTMLGSPSTEQAVNPTLDHSIHPDNFARETEIATTDETKHATLAPELIVAETNIATELPTDNFTTEIHVIKNNQLASAGNTLLNTKQDSIIIIHPVTLEKSIGQNQQNPTRYDENTMIDTTVTKSTQKLVYLNTELKQNVSSHSNSTSETVNFQNIVNTANIKDVTAPTSDGYSVTTDRAITKGFKDHVSTAKSDSHLTEAPQIFATNVNDNMLQPNKVEQVPSKIKIDIEEKLATTVKDNLATKKPSALAKSVKKNLIHIEFAEKDAAEHPKTIIIDENLSPDVVNTPMRPSKETENAIYDSLLVNFGRTTETSFVQHSVSTEQRIIKNNQSPIITDTELKIGQSTSEAHINPKQIPVIDTSSVVASAKPISDKTSYLNVEPGMFIGDTFEYTIPSIINEVNKVETVNNYLDMAAKETTDEPNHFIHGSTTSAPFVVTKTLAASEESFNGIENQTSNSEVILDSNKKMSQEEPIQPTDVINNALNPISNIIFNTNLNKSDVNKVETATGLNIASTSGLNSNVMKKETTESIFNVTETSLRATVFTNKENSSSSPINTKSDDSGITTTLNGQGIRAEFEIHDDLFKAEENKNLYSNLAPTMAINDKNEASMNYDQFNYSTDTNLKTLELNSNLTTIGSIDNNDASFNTEKSTKIYSVDLNDAREVNSNINLSQQGKTSQRPALPSVITSSQDEDGMLTQGSTIYAPVNVNIASKQIGNKALDQLEKPSETPYVTQFETTTIRDANKSRVDEVLSALQTRNSTSKFTQFEDVENVHPIIGNFSNTVSETSSQRAFTNVNDNVPQSGSNIQEPAQRTEENTNIRARTDNLISDPSIDFAKTPKTWDSITNTDSKIKWKTPESLIPKQDIMINLPTKITTDSSKSLPETGTFRTINVPYPEHEAKSINDVLRTGEPIILVVRNTSIDNPVTQHHVINEGRTDVNEINTSSSVITNAERSQASNIIPTKSSTVSRNLSHPIVINVNASSLTQDTNNNINNMQGNLKSHDEIVANQAEVVRQNQLLHNTSITQSNLTHDNGITVQNNRHIIASNLFRGENSSIAKESMNVSRKIYIIDKAILSQNNTNSTEQVGKHDTISSHKAVNTVNSTTQASAKTIPARPMSSVTGNPSRQVISYPLLKYRCINGTRGRYSDKDNCRKFYICIGNNQPIVGTCPVNTVFSDIKKLCTRNMSHCIRDNQFRCPSAGRFSDLINDVYYICVNHKNSLYRFKFQCQKGFTLNKTTIHCIENKEIVPNNSVSTFLSDRSESSASSASKSSIISSRSRGDSESSNSSQSKKSEEGKGTEKAEESEKPDNKEEDESDEVFICRKEGKFPIRNECRRYYLCKKNGKSEYRRKIKKCGSGDVFHKSKKKCVDADSYEC